MVPLNPPWALILNFELQVRKLAFKLVRDGSHSLADALQAVQHDAECRELHFTMPLAVSKRSIRDVSDVPHAPTKKPKGGGKSKNSKGVPRNQLAGNRPDGTQICFKFNTPQGCSDSDCARSH
eukprot:2232553-Amphidinium_carterae.1